MDKWQPILRVKGAAGTILLLGHKVRDDQWAFCRASDNGLPLQQNMVHSFSEALSLLGPSWKYLTPEYIHPQFKGQCWSLLAKQSGMFDRINWRKACL